MTTFSPPSWAIRGLPVDDAELQPEDSGADGGGLARVIRTQLRPPEHVDDVERSRRGDRVGSGREGCDTPTSRTLGLTGTQS